MTSMLEKMARAICRERLSLAGLRPECADCVEGERWPESLAIARAALLAIREPSAEIAEAAWLGADHTIESMGEDHPSPEQSCLNIFTAMIDAVLNGDA